MEGSAQNPAPSFSNVPYEQRWELLKPYLEQLYVQENRKLPEIVDIMKGRHKFYASEGQYKGKFSVWNLKKNIPTPKKTALCEKLHTRAQMGKSSLVTYKGQKMDEKKLRRLVKTKKRQQIQMELQLDFADIETLSGHALQCGNRIFMNWNMPHTVSRILRARAYDSGSPFGQATSTPSDIIVKTPSSAHIWPSPRNGVSPRDASSPKTAPSPMAVAVRDNVKLDRAYLFVHGRHTELLKGMGHEEKKTITDWMYQFWLFSYKTAKTWGHGPRKWTPSMLGFDDHQGRAVSNLPESPGLARGSPASYGDNQPSIREREDAHIPRPTPLCRWSIHVPFINYKEIPSPPPLVQGKVDPNKEDTWTQWPLQDRKITQLVDTLQANLDSNDFSNVEVNDLPISVTQVVKAAERSPEKLREEAFGFSIMGRNLDLIWDVLENRPTQYIDISGLYPLHLAATYLDGGKTCCNVFNALVIHMTTGETSVRKLYINHLNHTVLDNLMIGILKAHTSCLPSVVDDAFRKEPRFAGEEVDICGRWDADSKCIRALLVNGIPTIPFEWKHMFCHTSVQAICHCIDQLFRPHWGPDINTPSGIFTKRCSNETCGLKLQLMPLHTLVVTAVHLASQGSSGETMFGMLACLLCLLQNGANPLLTAPVSLYALLGNEEDHRCSHEEINPLELAQKVPDRLISGWSKEVKTGWRVLCAVFELSQAEWRPKPPLRRYATASEFRNEFSDFMEDMDDTESQEETVEETFPTYCKCFEEDCCYFGRNRHLTTLWAAVQTEFVTYRRLQEDDSWISPNFNMECLLESLTSGYDLSIDLVRKGMMKDYCDCGRFWEAGGLLATSEHVSKHYFSNLEDWNRSSFILTPEDCI